MAKDFAEIERMEAEAGLQATDGELTSEAKQSLTSRFVAQWEKKNARRAIRGGVVSTMALTLAACGDDDDDPDDSDPDTTPTAQTFTLTTSIDDGSDFTGGSGNDRFEQTKDGQLSIDDSLDGGKGTDELIIRDVQNDVSAFTAKNIETIDVRTAADGKTIDIVNASGYDKLVANASPNTVEFDNIALSEAATFVVQNHSSGKAVDFLYTNKDLAGSSDAATLELNAVTNATTVKIDDPDATAQLETLTIDSTADNTGAVTLSEDALTASTINITGSGDLDISGAALATKGTINASKLKGDLTVKLGTVDHTFTGGSGKDTVIEDVAGDIDKNDTLDGGKGVDTLELQKASGAVLDGTKGGNVVGVSDFETLYLGTKLTGTTTIDMSQISGLKDLRIANPDDETVTVTKLLNGAEVELEKTSSGKVALGLASNTSSDSLTLKLDGGGVTVADLDSGNAFLETLTIDSVGTSNNKITNLSDFDAKTIKVTGDQQLDADDNALSTSVSTFDASKATGVVKVQASATSTEITGGSKDDTLTGGNGADVIDGGAGKDTIAGGSGIDTVDGGAGDDDITFIIDTGDTITGGAGKDTIIMGDGGTTGTVTTITDFTSDDELDLDLSEIEALKIDGNNAITKLTLADGSNASATDSLSFESVAKDGVTLSTDSEIVAITGKKYADLSALVTDIGTAGDRTFDLGAAADDDDGFLVAYETTAGDSRIAVLQMNGAKQNSKDVNQSLDLVEFSSVGVDDLTALDVNIIA